MGVGVQVMTSISVLHEVHSHINSIFSSIFTEWV